MDLDQLDSDSELLEAFVRDTGYLDARENFTPSPGLTDLFGDMTTHDEAEEAQRAENARLAAEAAAAETARLAAEAAARDRARLAAEAAAAAAALKAQTDAAMAAMDPAVLAEVQRRAAAAAAAVAAAPGAAASGSTAAAASGSAAPNVSRVDKNLPKPQTWTGAKDSKLPRGRVWWQLVAAYCAAMGWDMLNYFVFFLGGKAAEWYYALADSCTRKAEALTLSLLKDEFLAFYDPSLRDEEREARTKLHKRECTMHQYPTVKQYEQEFKLLTRYASDLSETDQISWFYEGLSPTLKPLCVVDHQGKDWQSLEALIDFALGQEMRLDASRPRTQNRTPVAAAVAAAASYVPRPQTRTQTPTNAGARTQSKKKHDPIPGVSPGLEGLWLTSQNKGWTGTMTPNAPTLTTGAFQALMDANKCLQCGSVMTGAKGQKQCPNHPRKVRLTGTKRGGGDGAGNGAKHQRA